MIMSKIKINVKISGNRATMWIHKGATVTTKTIRLK